MPSLEHSISESLRKKQENEERIRSIPASKFIDTIKTYCSLNGDPSQGWIVGNIHTSLESRIKTYGNDRIRNEFFFYLNTLEVLHQVLDHFKTADGFTLEPKVNLKQLRVYVFQFIDPQLTYRK